MNKMLNQKLVEVALRYIGFSKKTEYEVKQKLLKYTDSINEIEDVLSHLKELLYIDDEEYVKAYIRQNLKFKKYSIFEIKNVLLKKKVNLQIIDNNLSDIDKLYENEVILKICKSKFHLDVLDEDFLNIDSELLYKIKRYLYNRGFKDLDTFFRQVD